MNKKLQVFVSSTYTDLIEERQAAVQAILDAGHIPAGMELFKAGKSQMKTIQRWIDESDVYMLILGGRYGSIEEESGLSYTELEYKYALSKNMPVFAIVLDDSFLFTKAASLGKAAIFEKDNVKKYKLFKKMVTTKIVQFPKNIDQISIIIHSHLTEILNDSDYNLIGWVHQYIGPDASELIMKNNLLKTQIQELESKLCNFESFHQAKIKEVQKELIDLFIKPTTEIPYHLLKDILSLKNITYKENKYTVLDFFKRYYINKEFNLGNTIKENSCDGVFLYLEKYGLIYRIKHSLYNLYDFTLSERGSEFCSYLQNSSN